MSVTLKWNLELTVSSRLGNTEIKEGITHILTLPFPLSLLVTSSALSCKSHQSFLQQLNEKKRKLLIKFVNEVINILIEQQNKLVSVDTSIGDTAECFIASIFSCGS